MHSLNYNDSTFIQKLLEAVIFHIACIDSPGF